MINTILNFVLLCICIVFLDRKHRKKKKEQQQHFFFKENIESFRLEFVMAFCCCYCFCFVSIYM